MAQDAWTEHFTENNTDKSNAKTVLDWFTLTTANKAENPARLMGLDDNAKVLFKYIIAGLVNSNPTTTDAYLTKIIDKLKAYFIGLKPEDQEKELVLFDLIVKANEFSPDVVFFMEPANPEEKFINNLPDFKDHMGDQMLTKVNFYEFIGIKRLITSAKPVKPAEFIQELLKKVTAKELEELNKLKDIFEEDPLNVKYSFKYKTHRALMILNIVIVMINHLGHNIEAYNNVSNVTEYKSLREKTESLLDFILLFKGNYYTLLNSQEMTPPPDLFHGFDDYIRSKISIPDFTKSPEERKNTFIILLNRLLWYFSKLEVVLEHSLISEIKTEECLYDLFDLVTVPLSIESEYGYPMRTIHFRRDFVIKDHSSSVSIEFHKIQSSLWYDIDKKYCYPKQIPLSLFLGILADVTKLEVFYNIMEFELGQEPWFKTHPEIKKIRAKLDKDVKCDTALLQEPIKVKNYSIDDKVMYANSMMNYLIYFTKNLDDAYLLASQKNSSNDIIIIRLANDAAIYLEEAHKATMKVLGDIIISLTPEKRAAIENVTMNELTNPIEEIRELRLSKDNVKSFVWFEGSLARFMNLLPNNGARVLTKYTEENIGAQRFADVLNRIYNIWTHKEYEFPKIEDESMGFTTSDYFQEF